MYINKATIPLLSGHIIKCVKNVWINMVGQEVMYFILIHGINLIRKTSIHYMYNHLHVIAKKKMNQLLSFSSSKKLGPPLSNRSPVSQYNPSNRRLLSFRCHPDFISTLRSLSDRSFCNWNYFLCSSVCVWIELWRPWHGTSSPWSDLTLGSWSSSFLV